MATAAKLGSLSPFVEHLVRQILGKPLTPRERISINVGYGFVVDGVGKTTEANKIG